MGRGYSFEALRAKILFTEGSHKKKLMRPKFVRQRDDGIRFSVNPDLASASMFSFADTQEPQEVPGTLLNYGADITTLTRLLEEGKL